jgi:hypothetical protein
VIASHPTSAGHDGQALGLEERNGRRACGTVVNVPKPAAHKWEFQARFRRGAFGWRGTAPATKRINEAISEIKKVARTDPVLAAEGTVVFLSRLSPALENIDSSSGAIGDAVNRAIEKLVPIIAGAPVDEPARSAWLERLWQALNDDGMAYIEILGEFCGELCATPALASQWADRLLPIVQTTFRDRGSYFNGTTPCLSALLKAARYQELLDLLETAPFVWWTYRQWGFQALVAQGKRAHALRYAEASRSQTDNSAVPIARACEQLLLQSGMVDEAYRRYAIAASLHESTFVARFRSLAKRYPTKEPATLLADLVASTPGEAGKWFAAAKSAGLFEAAIALANVGPTDPKTLTRAARDHIDKRPEFALEASLAALHWFGRGYGFDVTSLDIVEAYGHGLRAAESLGRSDEFRARAAAVIEDGDSFVRKSLRLARG